MKRSLALGYGVLCYLVFLVAFLYAIGFVGGFLVPRTIDDGIEASTLGAIVVNLLLLGLFAFQHSVMARPGFKRQWTRVVPATIERSTYVLLSSLVLILMFWQWHSMPTVVWDVTWPPGRVALWVLFGAGWLTVLASTFMINHFDLFGLRHVYLAAWRREYTHLGFREVMLYKVIRHPIMAGFIVAFWAAPTMTAGHLLFAIATTGYILIAVRLEEHDLVSAIGDQYRDYLHRVPGLIPAIHPRPESAADGPRPRPA